ncbi:DUF4279 domain-containing protein [Ferdinandcohnia sp. Marseille-Q9671]
MEQEQDIVYGLTRYILCFSFYSGIDEDDNGNRLVTKKDLDDYLGMEGSICFLKGEPNLFVSQTSKHMAIYSFWTKVLTLSDDELLTNEVNDEHVFLDLLYDKFEKLLRTHTITREKLAYIDETFDMGCYIQVYSYGGIPDFYLSKELVRLIASLDVEIEFSELHKKHRFLLNGADS